MANYDVLCFLEYYADRSNVLDGTKRNPTYQWQNFYQSNQVLGSADTSAQGDYVYLAFDVEGFGSISASSINDLTVELAATAEIVDITDTALAADNLVIASLYVQNAGSDAFHTSSAQLISRYIGSIEGASVTETTVSWKVNPAINKRNPQVPNRKITVNMVDKSNKRYV
jgi:hypothetical protein|tara:strand:+ start:256 stop:765 length:510 start_codon:yes stop_codon:yes gene_type:complete